jgi:hypothetical protein
MPLRSSDNSRTTHLPAYRYYWSSWWPRAFTIWFHHSGECNSPAGVTSWNDEVPVRENDSREDRRSIGIGRNIKGAYVEQVLYFTSMQCAIRDILYSATSSLVSLPRKTPGKAIASDIYIVSKQCTLGGPKPDFQVFQMSKSFTPISVSIKV